MSQGQAATPAEKHLAEAAAEVTEVEQALKLRLAHRLPNVQDATRTQSQDLPDPEPSAPEMVGDLRNDSPVQSSGSSPNSSHRYDIWQADSAEVHARLSLGREPVVMMVLPAQAAPTSSISPTGLLLALGSGLGASLGGGSLLASTSTSPPTSSSPAPSPITPPTTPPTTPPVADTTSAGLKIATVLGPVIAAVMYEVFDRSGQVLAHVVSDSTGQVLITLPTTFSGVVLIRASSLNGASADYVDEKSGSRISLDTPLRAYALIEAGRVNSVTVTPVTEIAVVQGHLNAGNSVGSTTPPDAAIALAANADVAKKFGLVSITASVAPVIGANGQANPDYNEADTLNTEAEHYGRVLAKLSGNDAISGSLAKTVDAYVSALRQPDPAQATQTVSALLQQGAKTFTFDNNKTAGYASLDTNPTNVRVLTAPLGINRLAAERSTGAVRLSDGSNNLQADSSLALSDLQISLTDVAPGQTIALPVALPAQALPGDLLTLTIPASVGGQAQTISRVLSAVEVGRGHAVLSVSSELWRASGDGDKHITATVSGPSGSGASTQISYDAWSLGTGTSTNSSILTMDIIAPTAPTLRLDASNPGQPASGMTTSAHPVLSGTAEAGSRVEVFVNHQTFTTTAGQDGRWTLTIDATLPASGESGTSYLPKVTSIDAAGNRTSADGDAFSVRLNASGGLRHDAANDTGTSSNDDLTRNPRPVIEGKVPGDATLVEVQLNGLKYSSNPSDTSAGGLITLGPVVTDGAAQVRSYSFTALALPHSNGAKYTPMVTAYIGGVPSTQSGNAFEVDLQGPPTQGISARIQPDAVNDTGPSSFDGRTRNPTPTLSGTGEPGATVSVTIKNTAGIAVLTSSATVNASGTWTLPIQSALDGTGANGQTYTPHITLTDKAGNSSTQVGSAFTVDTVAPTIPAANADRAQLGGLNTASDYGLASDDNITSLTTPLLSGQTDPQASVQVRVGSQTLSSLADANGVWQVQVTQALPGGHYTPQITVTDLAGNVSSYAGRAFDVLAATPSVAVTLDAVLEGGVALASIPGTLKIGQTLRLKFSFDTDPGDSFNLDDVRTTSGSIGALSSKVTTLLTDGSKTYAYTAVFTPQAGLEVPSAEVLRVLNNRFFDLAGNANADGSDANNDYTIAVDTLAPSVQIQRSGAGSLNRFSQEEIRFVFSEDPGNSFAWDAQAQTGDVSLAGGRLSALVKSVDAQGNTVFVGSFVPTPDQNTQASIQIEASRVQDAAGNDNAPSNVLSMPVSTHILTVPTGGLKHDSLNDSGLYTDDNLTANRQPALTGIATPGTEVQVKIMISGTERAYTTRAQTSGVWELLITDPLQDGQTYSFTVTSTDSAGNTASFTGTAFMVDAQAPAPSSGSLSHDAANDTLGVGIGSTDDNLTHNRRPEISGQGEPFSTVLMQLAGKTYDAVVNAQGRWAITVDQDLPWGTHTPIFFTLDDADNFSESTGTPFTVDYTAPLGTTAHLKAVAGNDTGALGDNLTATTQPVIDGTAEPDSLITLLIDGKTYTTLTAANGLWSVIIGSAPHAGHSLQPGSYSAQVSVSDAAGNSAVGSATSFTIDTTAPEVTVTGMPAQLKAGDSAVITFSFSEDPGTSFGLGDVSVTGGSLSAPQVDAQDPKKYTAIFTPTPGLASGTASVTVGPGVFSDAAGHVNPLGAQSSSNGNGNNSSSASVDSLAPSVVAVSISGLSAQGTPKTNLVSGDWVQVQVQFDEAVYVGSGGNPVIGPSPTPVFNIALDGNSIRPASYVSGSGSNTLTLRYLVTNEDADTVGGVTALASSLSLAQGITLRDSAGNDARLGTPAVPAGANSLSLDTTAPTVTLTRDDSLGLLNSLNAATLRFTFSEAPMGFTESDIVISGSGGSLVAGSFSGPLTDAQGRSYYTVQFKAGSGVAHDAVLGVAGLSFADGHGNANGASLLLSLAVNTLSVGVPAGQLSPASDTGNGQALTTTDQRTRLAHPMLRGTADANTNIEVSLVVAGQTMTYMTATNAQGVWNVSVDDTLEDGVSYSPSVKATHASGNTATGSVQTFTVDLSAPLSSGITGDLLHHATYDTGFSNTDSLTNNSRPKLVGTAEALARVEVSLNNGSASVTYVTQADANGAWELSVPTNAPLPDGRYTPSIRVIDAAGNATVVNAAAFTIDTNKPMAGTITGALSADTFSDSGQLGDNLTSQLQPQIKGLAEPGTRIAVLIDGQIYTTTADTHTGGWVVTVGDASHPGHVLGSGAWPITITATDAAGNSETVAGTPFTVNTTNPDPQVRLAQDSSSGTQAGYASDSITKDTALEVYDTAPGALAIEFRITGGPGGANGVGSGTWKNNAGYTTEMAALSDGSYTVYVRQYDAANVAGAGQRSITLTKDTSAAPLSVSLASDSGNGLPGASTDRVSNDGNLNISTPEAGAILQYSADNQNWTTSYTPPSSSAQDGDKTWYVRQLDRAGNASVATVINYRFDHTAPDSASITGQLQAGLLGDTGANSADNLTHLRRPVYSGTSADPGATVVVVLSGDNGQSLTLHTSVSPLGVWQVTPGQDLTGTHYTASVTVTDLAGNATTVTGAAFDIDTIVPTVTISAPQSMPTLLAGDTVTLTLTFSEDPGSSLTFWDFSGSGGYISGMRQASANNPLVYLLDIVPANNYEGPANITLSANRFEDSAGNANTDSQTLTIQVDSRAPKIDAQAMGGPLSLSGQTWVNGVGGGAWQAKAGPLVAGDAVLVNVQFTEAVTVTGQPGFYLSLNNGAQRSALYAGGSGSSSLQFRYIVAAGDNDDAGGITAPTNALELGAQGAYLTDTLGNPAFLATPRIDVSGNGSNTLTIDTVLPTLTLSKSGNHVLTQDNISTSRNSETITFSFSEDPGNSFDLGDVRVRTAGDTLLSATTDYAWGPLSAKLGTGTLADPYRYTASFTGRPTWAHTGDIRFDVAAGQVQDGAGNANPASNALTLAVDNVKPSIDVLNPQASAQDANGQALTASSTFVSASQRPLGIGDRLLFTLHFDQEVFVTGRPELAFSAVNAPAGTLKAVYDPSLSDGSNLVLSYLIKAGDFDNVGGVTFAANALSLAGGTVRDVNGNQALLGHGASATNVLAIDAVAPSVDSVSLISNAGADNTYVLGDVVRVQVVFKQGSYASEAVFVTGSGANAPFVNLNIGGVLRPAYYASGSGSNTWVFEYTIAAGDNTSSSGITLGANALAAGNGGLADASGNAAQLAHAAVSAGSVNHLVDSQAPSLSVSRADNQTLILNADSGVFTFSFSEDPGTSFALGSDVVVKHGSTLLTQGSDYQWSSVSTKLGAGTQADPYRYTAVFTALKPGMAGTLSFDVPPGAFSDLSGNQSTQTTRITALVNTAVANQPGIALTQDTHNSSFGGAGTASDGVTSNLTLSVTGAAVGDTLELRIDSGAWLSVTDYYNAVTSLADGVYNLSARLIDISGNISPTSPSLNVTKDSAASPLTLSFTDTANANGGTLSSDTLTSSTGLSVTGAESGALVQYRIGSGAWLSLADYTSAMAVGGSAGGDGVKVVSVRQIDLAGNVSAIAQTTFVLDRTAPQTSSVSGGLKHDSTSDTGTTTGGAASFSDNVTRNTTPQLSGVAEVGSHVAVTLSNGALYNQTYATTADSVTGAWSVQVTQALPSGSWTPRVVVTDLAGNSAQALALTPFTVDATAPQIVSLTANPSALKVGEVGTVTINFSEEVVDFALDDLVVSGGALSSFSRVSATQYTALYTPLQGVTSGVGGVFLARHLFSDVVGNVNTATSSVSASFSYNTQAPELASITRLSSSLVQAGTPYQSDAYLSAAEIASGQSASFLVTFTDKVKGLNASNFQVLGLSGYALADVSISVSPQSLTSGVASQWRVDVSNLSSISTTSAVGLRLDLVNRTGVQDASGNALQSSSFTTGDAYLFDAQNPQAPVVTSGMFGEYSPKITGLADPGTQVTVVAGKRGTVGATYVTTADMAGVWQIDTAAGNTSTQTKTGTYTQAFNYEYITTSAYSIDAAGNVSAQSSVDVMVHAAAPRITTWGSTSQTTPQILGTSAAGNLIDVDVGGAVYTVKTNANGQWFVDTGTTVTTPAQTISGTFSPVTQGSLVITAVVKGNSLKTSSVLLVDTTPPTAPVIASSSVSNDTTPAISGTAEPFMLVRVAVGQAVFTTNANAMGQWSIDTGLGNGANTATGGKQTLTGSFSPISNGTWAVAVNAVDGAGNVSPSTSQNLRIDTIAPAAAQINALGTTGDSTPLISGTAEAGATVTVAANGATYKVLVAQDGQWAVDTGTATPTVGSFDAPTGSVGAYLITASQTDTAGNVQSVPTIERTTYSADYPSFTHALYTNQKRPTLAGTAAPAKWVSVSIAGASYTVQADAQGRWVLDTASATPSNGIFTPISASTGTYTVVASVDSGAQQVSQSITLDQVAPSLALSSAAIAGDNIINANEQNTILRGTAELGASVTLNFGPLTRTATVAADGSWSYQMTGGDVQSLGQSAGSALGDKSITVTARDRAGNQTTEARTLTIDTVAPVFDMDRASSTPYVAALRAKNVAYALNNYSTFGVTDALVTESAPVTRITVGVSPISVPDAGYEYLVVGETMISVSGYDLPSSVTFGGMVWGVSYQGGVISLTAQSVPGNSDPAQAVLRNMRYINTSSGAVLATQSDRLFNFTLYDQAGNASTPVTSIVTTDATGPVIDLDTSSGNTFNTVAVLANSSTPQTLAGSASLSEGKLVTSVSVAALGLQDGSNEKLVVGGVSLALNGSGVAANTLITVGGGQWKVNAQNSKLVFTQKDALDVTPLQAQSLIQALQYLNSASSKTDGLRSLTISATDSVGNATADPPTARINFNNATPRAANINPVITLDGNGDGVLGDQFTVTFSELVRVSNVAGIGPWTLSGGASLGTGASVTALDAVTLPFSNGSVTYARSFLFTAGTNPTYTTGSTLTIGTANVLDTGNTAASAPVVFTLPDIVPPAKPTPLLNIAGDNLVSATERASAQNVSFNHLEAVAGDILKLYRDGVWFKDVTLAAGATQTTTTFQSGSADWGTDGRHVFTARVQDSAGNVSPVSTPKSVRVDTGITSGIASISLTQDGGTLGVPDAGDKLTLVFNEALSLPTTVAQGLPAALFGTGASAVAKAPIGGLSTTWEVTLGSNPDVAMAGKTLSLSAVQDAAGNSGSVSAALSSDLFAKPVSIQIANVTTDNILSKAERDVSQAITMNLTGAKAGDVVQLSMDGVTLGQATVSSNGQTSIAITVAAKGWGDDGERYLSASIQRGAGTAVSSPLRSVYVNAESVHWSAVNASTFWFDPDSLALDTGAQVTSWSASAGVASGNAALSMISGGLATGQVIFSRDASGHGQLYFNGSSTLSSSGVIAVPLLSTGFADFSMLRLISTPSSAYAYAFSRYMSSGANTRFRSQMGTGVGGAVTDHFSEAFDSALGPTNSATVNNWIVLGGYSTRANGVMGVAMDGTTLSTIALNSNGVGNWGTPADYTNTTTGNGPSSSIVMGGTADTSFVHTQKINAILGDQIAFNAGITAAQRDEVAIYLAQKYQSVGTQITVKTRASAGSSQSYDLSLSAGTSALLDDVLQLGNTSQGAGVDIITVAGRDYVNAGAGNDVFYAKDLNFRTLDGGLGFDTFVLDAAAKLNKEITLSDYLSNVRGNSGNATNDARVNATGYNALLGIERFDFSQNADVQDIAITSADVAKRADVIDPMDPQSASGVNNLYMVLGNNDYLRADPSGMTLSYGRWLDGYGLSYDHKFSATVSGENVNLFTRGGDWAPELGTGADITNYSVNSNVTSITMTFNEEMTVSTLSTLEFWITQQSGSVVWPSTASMTANQLTLTYNGVLTGPLSITYSGTTLKDTEGEQIRFKNFILGSDGADVIDKSSQTTDWVLIGGLGNDNLIGGSGNDLFVGRSGSDVMTGNAGADIFRFAQYTRGTDLITDFNVTQGDVLDLRGILTNTGFDLQSNVNAYLQINNVGQNMQIKIDPLGIGNFSTPDETITLLTPQGMNLTVEQMLLQRIILV